MLEQRTIKIEHTIQDIWLRTNYQIISIEGLGPYIYIKVTGNPTTAPIQKRIFVYSESNRYHANELDGYDKIGSCRINVSQTLYNDFRDVTVFLGDKSY